MVKAIIFDLWGTLVEQGVWSPIKQVSNILKIRMPFSDYVVRMQKAMMLNPFNGLREAFLELGEEFNMDITNTEMDELIGMWNKAWMLAKPYGEVIEVLDRLKGKYQLVLVANTNKFSVEKVIEKFSLDKYFDKIFLSYQLGMTKNVAGFFDKVIEELNLEAKDCVMVGDSIQSDILPAKSFGMQAVLVDRKGKREYDIKIKNLNELEGVLL
jgi:HAD superfamily hydrolase (TIGR01549 family)